jgi:sugar lactone lactonase YvrE
VKPSLALMLALSVALAPRAGADQGSFTNAGGSSSAGAGVSVTSAVAAPAGTLTLNCPAVGTGACAGGSLSYASTDGATTISASFTSGTFAESCSGGGKGGHITCAYSFTGYISGTRAVSGHAEAINGVTYQMFGTGGAAAKGTTAFNSAYTPFYYSDSEQIHRSDDLQGTNQISFGSQGAGPGQFYGAYGLALDAAGRIYVADTYNCRVVRIDDMTGKNWVAYGGACGAHQGEFSDPSGIAVDSAGKIYVMDTGNARVVRIDDLSGANWIAYGAAGNGVGQFSPSLTSVAVDASGRIYVPDAGNARLVRIDDMSGTNWTVLTQSPPVNGVSAHSFQSPVAVALDAAGRIYVADNQSYQPAVARVDDMTGANWTSIYTGGGAGGLNSVAVDPSGIVFTGGGGVRIVDGMAAVLTSSGSIGPIGSYYVFGVTPVPLADPRPSAVSVSPSTLSFSESVGQTSVPQVATIANFGGSALNVVGISAEGGFAQTNNCPDVLDAGASCAVSVTFTPPAAGPAAGSLVITDDSGNLGGSQAVSLTGEGTAPAVSVSPATLLLSAQVGVTSASRSVVVRNTGTEAVQVTSVTTATPFSQTNTCSAALAPGATCSVLVSFSPASVGSVSGSLAIVDSAGTQSVGLTGRGTRARRQH